MTSLVGSVFTHALTAFGTWIATTAWIGARESGDRESVFDWMSEHTRDETGCSHVDLVTIAKGTRLPEERVRRACMTDDRVFRHSMDDTELWSIWRERPQQKRRAPVRVY